MSIWCYGHVIPPPPFLRFLRSRLFSKAIASHRKEHGAMLLICRFLTYSRTHCRQVCRFWAKSIVSFSFWHFLQVLGCRPTGSSSVTESPFAGHCSKCKG